MTRNLCRLAVDGLSENRVAKASVLHRSNTRARKAACSRFESSKNRRVIGTLYAQKYAICSFFVKNAQNYWNYGNVALLWQQYIKTSTKKQKKN